MCFANLIKNGGSRNGTFIPHAVLSPNRGIFVGTLKLNPGMLNFQDYIAGNPSFRKMAVDDLLFVEYKCPLVEGDLEVWWHNNFFEFVLAGSITLKTMSGQYTLNAGDCVFAKKGSVIASSHRQDTFCDLI